MKLGAEESMNNALNLGYLGIKLQVYKATL